MTQDKRRDELKKECGWDLLPVRQPHDPKNNDFFEADVSKILAREKKMLEEIKERVVKLPRYMEMQQAVIKDVLCIIKEQENECLK